MKSLWECLKLNSIFKVLDTLIITYIRLGSLYFSAMVRRYVCKACNKWCRQDVTHITKRVAIVRRGRHALSPPSESPAANVKTFYELSVFREQQTYHLEWDIRLWKQGMLHYVWSPSDARNHECNKQYCEICYQKRDVGHLCFMSSLKDVLPAKADSYTDFVILCLLKIRGIPTQQKHMWPK